MQQDQVPTPGCAIFAQPPEYHHNYTSKGSLAVEFSASN